jgi:hypothetical protein
MNRHEELIACCDEFVSIKELSYKMAYQEESTWVVYFLLQSNRIVYIGETYKPLNRFLKHAKENTKQFDSVCYKILPDFSDTKLYESLCMTYLGEFTKYNKIYKLKGDPNLNPIKKPI